MGCRSCGGGSRRRHHNIGRLVVPGGPAAVPKSIAVFLRYTGVIRVGVRGPRTKSTYGKVSPGDTLAVFKEDAEFLVRQGCFEYGRDETAINLSPPSAQPTKETIAWFAVV